MLNKAKNRRGIISIFVLLMITLYVVMGISLFEMQESVFRDASNTRDGIQAKLLAETALQEAEYYSRNINSSFSGSSSEQTMNIDGQTQGTYEYTVAKSGNKYSITGIGYVPSKTSPIVSVTLTSEYRSPNPYTIFSDNFESNSLAAWAGEDNDTNADWDVSTDDPNNGTYHARAYRTSGSNKWAKLLTPQYDLSDYDTVELRFSIRRKNNADKFRVFQNLTGNPSDWTQIYDASGVSTSDYDKPAKRVEVSSPTATTQFRFDARMDSGEEWYLDDVLIASPYTVYDSTVDSN